MPPFGRWQQGQVGVMMRYIVSFCRRLTCYFEANAEGIDQVGMFFIL
jgi:hypothetical protein